MKPDTPPMTNTMMKPAKNRKAVLKTGRPVQIVASQAKNDDRARDRDDERDGAEERQRHGRQAGREHVVQPDAEAEHHRQHRRQRHSGIADQRTAAADRQGLARPC